VSVIVPCFNYGHLLAETLDCVRRQTLRDWECIVVDDGSTDRTGDVARSFVSEDRRFSYLHQDNRGLSAARNAGLRVAKGEYAQLLDADDLVEDDKLRVHTAFLDAQEGFALVYGPMLFFRDRGGSRGLSRGRGGVDAGWMTMWPDTNDPMLSALIDGNQFPVSAALFRLAVLGEVGYFDEALRSHEDWEFWLRWAFAGKRFHGLEARRTATLIREHESSMTRRAVTMAETRLEVRKRIDRLARSEALQARNRECTVYDTCELAAARIASGLWRVGIPEYLRGLVRAKSKARAIYLLLAQLAPDWLRTAWRTTRRFARA
jgi:glycosyltransferase involved in cell wall biosynthesis